MLPTGGRRPATVAVRGDGEMTDEPQVGPRAARRLTVRRWRDPRLVTGIVLVVGATALGARVAVAQDDADRYWSVGSDVRAGEPVRASDLVPQSAGLTGSTSQRYVLVDAELPADLTDLVWTRDVSAGALVDETAWGRADDGAGHLPLRVALGSFPGDLGAGDRIDVWVGPGPGDDPTAAAEQVLADVRVVDPGGGGSALGTDLTRTVLVDLGELQLSGADVAALAARHVTIVRLP